ncbi:MAG TPA: UrcA family protein [Steroidobacteraceae bacterium]|jgi:UrcA family protein|nr:UrcA family protein [Steroidobacteraceae bacterium]
MKTTIRVKRELSPLLACGLAAVFIGAAASRAAADTPLRATKDGTSYSMEISYNRADLATEAGLDKIYQRIKGAARRVCTAASEPSDPRKTKHYWECVDLAVGQAVRDVDNQSLTARHQRQAEKQKRVG